MPTNPQPIRRRSSIRSYALGGTAALALTAAVLAGGGLLAAGAAGPVNASQTANTGSIITPTTFSALAKKVKPAVVSIQVKATPRSGGDLEGKGGNKEHHQPFGQRGGSQFDEFFKRFFDERQFGNPSDRGQFERRFGQRRDGPNQRRRGASVGSGFIISADGYVVTNNHVIDGGDEITVVMDDGKKYEARLIGADKRTDLAVLKIDGHDLPNVSWTSKTPQVGDWVMAVGNPFGLGGTVTTGIVSAKGRAIGSGPYDDFLQIDAAVNRGNSGGPTFNLNGDVVGVNTAIYSPSGGSVGIGFAISAKLARTVVADLKEDGVIIRGWLGVSIQDVSPEIAQGLGLDGAGGALVSNVTQSSPAEAGGLQVGDTVLAVSGIEIETTRDLAGTIAAIKPGKDAELKLWRNGKEKTLSVEIGTLPGQDRLASMQKKGPGKAGIEPASYKTLGIEVEPFDGQDGGDKGVIVSRVRPGSDAEDKGFSKGDHILSIAGAKILTLKDFETAVEAAADEDLASILLLVRSNDRQRFVSLKLGQA